MSFVKILYFRLKQCVQFIVGGRFVCGMNVLQSLNKRVYVPSMTRSRNCHGSRSTGRERGLGLEQGDFVLANCSLSIGGNHDAVTSENAQSNSHARPP